MPKKPTPKKPPATQKPEPLKPCPLCGSDPFDRGCGVGCNTCGLWMGDGTAALRLGGYRKVWNTRHTAK